MIRSPMHLRILLRKFLYSEDYSGKYFSELPELYENNHLFVLGLQFSASTTANVWLCLGGCDTSACFPFLCFFYRFFKD